MRNNTRTSHDNGLDFSPACSPDQIAELEKAAQRWGVNRRIAFVIATKSRSELTEIAADLAGSDEDALLEMIDGMRGLIEHHQKALELFSAVEARLLVAAHDALNMPFEG